MSQQMATASVPSVEDEIKELVPQLKERNSCVVFVFHPLPTVRRVPACIEAKLKAERSHKGRRRNERNEEVIKDYRVPISRSFLLFMEYASKGKLQLPHVVVDETAGDGQIQPRLMGGKVKEDNGELKLVAAPGRLPALRVLNQELGRLGGTSCAPARSMRISLRKTALIRR